MSGACSGARRLPSEGRAGIALALTLTAVAAAQPPTFRSGVDLVRLDVSVTRGGQPVRGLTAKDFRIFDRGVAQRVESVTLGDDLPVSLIMALDISSSVAGPRLEHLVDAGRGLVAALRPTDRTALVTFSSEISVDVPLTGDRGAMLAALGGLKGRGATALRDATWAALNLKPDDDSRAMVLVFTDGVDTASWLTHSQVLAGARRLGVVVHAVELSDNQPYRQLRFLPALTDATGGREWSATSSRDLRELFTRAIDEMRARYLVTFYPQGAPAPGWHELKVDVNSRGDVRTRPGYFVNEGTR